MVLVKSIIAAKPIHHFMVMEAPTWVFAELVSWMRSFFWKGKEKVNGGQCLVVWNTICRPTHYGRLGVKNLQLQALALRVRWEWLHRTDPDRPWHGIPMVEDKMARRVFDSLVHIIVGDWSRVLFWRDRWIHGFTIIDIAPLIYNCVEARTRIRRPVQEATDNNRWLNDFHGELSFTAQLQLMQLGHVVASVHRNTQADQFSWPSDTSRMYTTRSTYQRLCIGLERSPFAECVWRSWAPLRCKIFTWLAAQHRLWTSYRCARHGLQDRPSTCFIYLQEEDNVDHILVQCVYVGEVWHYGFQELDIHTQRPELQDTFLDWWLLARTQFRQAERRGFDTLVIVTAWALWKQRNARVFNIPHQFKSPRQLLCQIASELQDLKSAGIGVGDLQRFVR